MRVFIVPTYRGQDRADGGIRRVCEAQERYLPQLGIDVTDNVDVADLIACHGTSLVERPGVPLVAHNHGLMWHEYKFGAWGEDVNRAAIELLVRAQAITAPSHWVAHAITRGMLARPEVIYHGVDAHEWEHSEQHRGYVLWNKARIDPVSDPTDMNDVAALLPQIPFVSTFGHAAPNLLVIGPQPYETMKPVVQRAAVYLATARETFGIGTLEALASGVPIAGWRYGGQAEIVREGETGYLAEWGDYRELASCIERCIAERERLSTNCIADAMTRWGWEDKILGYAALYERVVNDWKRPRPKVSVIVTTHNLTRYLPDALRSVKAQTMADWECIVIDDFSDDDPQPVVKAEKDKRFLYRRTPHNLGLSGARNYGFQHATGRYILHLDADDTLAPNALDVLSHALDQHSDIHIAYGAIETMAEDGTGQKRNPWPAGTFNWNAQIAHLNQMAYAAMVRREVLERSGGYRLRDWRAEDASLWTRLTSFGFRAAYVTDEPTLIYRIRKDSKGSKERQEHADVDGDWTAWYPWRLAGTPHDGVAAMERGAQPNAALVPFAAQGRPQPPARSWPVRHHQEPVVSVILPVGPGHQAYLIDALDSVQAQTLPQWEAIVVNDTGESIELPGHPWACVVQTDGKTGAGKARNIGLQIARAPLVTFLDADDVLCPRALEEMAKAFVKSGGRYAYTDWLTLEDERKIDGPLEAHSVEEYDPRKMLAGLRHAVTALVPTAWARECGGFDEALPVFEDWQFYCNMAVRGMCGVRVPIPLLIYRTKAGMRTRQALAPREPTDDGATARYTPLGESVATAIAETYQPFRTGDAPIMACGTCGSPAPALGAAQNALADLLPDVYGAQPMPATQPVVAGSVRLEFVGEQWGAMTYIGKVSGRQYRAGREPNSRYIDADPRDVEHLLSLERFAVREIGANDAGETVGAMTPHLLEAQQSATRRRGQW